MILRPIRSRSSARLLSVTLDAESTVPLHRQVYDELRARIVAGQLSSGALLPSSRALAMTLRVSRNTVVMAYERLRAEGYVTSRPGGGTSVCTLPPEVMMRAAGPAKQAPAHRTRSGTSRRATHIVRLHALNGPSAPRAPRPFRIDAPAIDAFPLEIWNRTLARVMRQIPPRHLSYGETFGLYELRALVAEFLTSARGVRCSVEQIMITCGSQQALTLAAGVLLDPGDAVWVEDPGYSGARGAFAFAEAKVVPVPVDAEGLDVAAGERRAPGARVAFVTPSRQLPLGVRMSVERRAALLDWARRAKAWVIEDDRDSEFRYSSRPVGSLQGMDTEGCVLYLGTFSRAMFPALRLGYLVVPDAVRDAFAAARHFADLHQSYVEQAAMAAFIRDGHFERHVRHVRATYLERQHHLVAETRRYLDGRLAIDPADAGMELIGWLSGGEDDVAVAASIREDGVEVTPLSPIPVGRPLPPGLILGYAGLSSTDITDGVQRVARAMERRERVTGQRSRSRTENWTRVVPGAATRLTPR